MQIVITIPNLSKMISALNTSPTVVTRHLDSAIRRSIFWVERKTKPLTPVDTGLLRANQMSTFSALRGVYEPTQEYAYWVEVMDKNKHKVGQSRFLQTGVDQATPEIKKEFEQALNDALNELAGKAND